MLAGSFDLRRSLFHMVFNRTVENFYRTFTIYVPRERKLA